MVLVVGSWRFSFFYSRRWSMHGARFFKENRIALFYRARTRHFAGATFSLSVFLFAGISRAYVTSNLFISRPARHAPSAKKGEGALRARADMCACRGVKSHRDLFLAFSRGDFLIGAWEIRGANANVRSFGSRQAIPSALDKIKKKEIEEEKEKRKAREKVIRRSAM